MIPVVVLDTFQFTMFFKVPMYIVVTWMGACKSVDTGLTIPRDDFISISRIDLTL